MVTINERPLDDGVVERLKLPALNYSRSLEGEAHNILKYADEDDMEAKRVRFLKASRRMREWTRGRKHTPAKVLIRKDRDRCHGVNF